MNPSRKIPNTNLSYLLIFCSLIFILFQNIFYQPLSNLISVNRIIVGIPIITLLLGLMISYKKPDLPNKVKKYLLFSLIIFLVYATLGLINENVNIKGVMAYSRSYWIFIIMFLAGIMIEKTGATKQFKYILLFFFFLCSAFILLEQIFQGNFATLMGYTTFSNIDTQQWDASHFKPFLNFFKQFIIYRPEGPLGTTISLSYLLVIIPFFYLENRSSFIALLFLSFFLILALGAKGPLITYFILLLILSSHRFFNRYYKIFIFIFIVCLSLSTLLISKSDNHGIGFINGIFNLLENPFGEGLGYGGNLSGEFFNYYSDKSRNLSFGSESIFGTYFTQFGFFYLLHLYTYFLIIRSIRIINNRSLVASSLCTIIVLMGINQEEAHSTYAAISFILLGIIYYRQNFIKHKKPIKESSYEIT